MYTSDTNESDDTRPITLRIDGSPKTDLIEISKIENRTPTGEIKHLISEQKLRLKHKQENPNATS